MTLGSSKLEVPVVAVGCMRINTLDADMAEKFVKGAVEIGATFFDHADVYGDGRCEEIFADAIGMTSAVRDTIILQSKVGIRPGVAFDFSKKHILESVDGILSRLRTDHLDALLLHRPDALVEPEEVAEAFDELENTGKVKHFGVSNQNPMQIELLRRWVRQPLVANQLQLSITNTTMITAGVNVNMLGDSSVDRDGSILDYCRLHDITIQPWSPFQYGFFEGVFLGNEKFPELNRVLDEISARYDVSSTTMAIAWLLRHPAKMQPVTGTMNLDRLTQCAAAGDVHITREEWYEIYLAAGNILP
ncbi:putative oxidoreductase [Nakamurella sp. UYEF19]